MASAATDTSSSAFGPEEQPKSAISICAGSKLVVLLRNSLMAASIGGFILFCAPPCSRVLILQKIWFNLFAKCPFLHCFLNYKEFPFNLSSIISYIVKLVVMKQFNLRSQ
jgi:hypothetical protein